jgi:uncharacterized protein
LAYTGNDTAGGTRLPVARFGANGPVLTRLGFGGIPIQQLPEADAVAVVRKCYDVGIRLFDTAYGYTNSEERIGKALAGVRDDVFVVTKSPARDLETLRTHFETSLKRTGFERFDLFLFHNVSSKAHLQAILGAADLIGWMHRQQEAGRVGMIGISSHQAETAVECLRTGEFAAVEFPFNYLEDQALPELLPLAREMGVGFLAMKPMAGGALSNGRAAIKWLMAQPDVHVIPGMMTLDQVDDAVAAVTDPELTSGEEAAIARDRQELSGSFCRRCGYCLPCPQGIPVNTIVSSELFLNRAGWQRADDRYLQMLQKAADDCQQCGECEARCPYNLPLTQLVRETALSMATRVREHMALRSG